MRFKFAAAALIAVAASLAGCSGSSEPVVTRAVDVSALTFADVQQRAREAATQPGAIFHLSDTQHGDGDANTETWLDIERRVARTEREGEIEQIFGPEKLAMLSPLDGRYQEALYSWDGVDEPILTTLGYLRRLIDPRAESKGIEGAVVDGAPAIKVRVEQEFNYDGDRRTEKAAIYFDEAFLPLKIELDLGGWARTRSTHIFRSEYVARDAVPADFFSFEHVRAKAKTSEDLLREAAKPFERTYWLGEPFEEMVIEQVSSGEQDDGEPYLDVTYRLPTAGSGGPGAPYPCAGLSQYTRRGWDSLVAARRQNSEAPTRVERETRAAAGGEAHIFEQPADRVLPPPQIEGEPPPRIPTLVESSQWIAEIAFDETIVEVRVDCGPPGQSPYRSLDGMRHLLDSLQVLEVG